MHFGEHQIFFFFGVFISVFKLVLDLNSTVSPRVFLKKLFFFKKLFLVLMLNSSHYLGKNCKFSEETKKDIKFMSASLSWLWSKRKFLR